MQKRAVQFTKKPLETADKFAKDYAIKKSFRHALHLVTAHLHRQNQLAHSLRTRGFWLAKLSIHFPIHFTRRMHEYPITLTMPLYSDGVRSTHSVSQQETKGCIMHDLALSSPMPNPFSHLTPVCQPHPNSYYSTDSPCSTEG